MVAKIDDRQNAVVKVQFRRDSKDMMDGKRAYFVYFYLNGSCFGSVLMSSEKVEVFKVGSQTKKEATNLQITLSQMQDDLKTLVTLMDETGENSGVYEGEVKDMLVIKKRGRPPVDDKPLLRTTILLTQEDMDKLKILGGATWVRSQVREAKIPGLQ